MTTVTGSVRGPRFRLRLWVARKRGRLIELGPPSSETNFAPFLKAAHERLPKGGIIHLKAGEYHFDEPASSER